MTASDGELTSEPTAVLVTLPDRIHVCVAGQTALAPREWVPLGLHLNAELGGCDTPQPPSWLALLGKWLEALLGRLG